MIGKSGIEQVPTALVISALMRLLVTFSSLIRAISISTEWILDGSNIVSSTVRANAGLALDKVNQEVYVTDNVTNTIRKCAYSDITSPTGIYSKPSDSLVMGALAIDQSATYLVWGESNVGPTS